MAQDEVIVKYKAVPEGFDKVGVAVNSVTQDTKELQTQIKATFADKSITEATANLDAHGDKVDEVGKKYTTAKAELRALTNEITSGKLGAKEMDAAVKRAADLTDHIGDVRNEIKKLSSDTRVFDLLAQGARGVAAGFSVATGLAASFGSENKDLQKTLMKVQGAMATLQGVQELANIATEKGGIATKAYGVALQVVDKISKVTGLSMAASWAVATAGLTILIAGVISLIAYLGQANEASDTYAKDEADRQKELAKKQKETQEEKMAEISAYEKKKFEEQEYWRKKEQIAGKDVRAVEVKQLEENIAYYKDFLVRSTVLSQDHFKEYKDLSVAQYNELRIIADKYVIDAEIKRQDLLAQIRKDAIKKQTTPQVSPVDALPLMTTVDPLVTEEVVDMNKRNADKMWRDLKEFAYDKAISEQEKYNQTKAALDAKMWSDSFALAQTTIASINSLVQFGYDSQLQALQLSKQREVEAAGDNAEKRKKVEQRYAIESAKIERQKAIAEKAAAIFGIGVALAQAIQKIQAEAAVLSSNPITAALAGNAYAQIGIAAGLSAIQIAVIAAKPLPAIPTFERGGAVALAGGRIADGHLIGRSHRQGGILIEAQGKEYIWDEQTTAKHGDIIKAAHENRIEDLVFHKYVVPMMKSSFTPNAQESYDDKFLRSTIRQTSKQTAKDIVNGISKNMNDAIYLTQRYKN